MEDHLRHIPVVIRMTDPEQGFAKGGLATAASRVRDAGRKGDDMLLHVNKDEFELLRQQWGEPTIHPRTGMPEFWSFKKLAKKLAGPVAGVVANAVLPGAGVLGSSLGRAVASGAIGAGVGYLADGKDGAIYGGLAGGASPYVFGGGGNPGLLTGTLGKMSGALGGVGGLLGGGGAQPAAAAGKAAGASSGGGGILGGLFGKGASAASGGLSGLSQNAKLGMTALSMLGAGLGSNADDKEAEKAAKAAQQEQERFNAPIPEYDLARTQVAGQPIDYYNYGLGPEQDFYDRNNEYVVKAAEGGAISELMPEPQGGDQYVTGPGDGRDDTIPARLSDGEYVFDAETVALIGDGSNKAGAQRLDEMREAVRAHKGGALAQGQISPDAAHPLQYLQMRRA